MQYRYQTEFFRNLWRQKQAEYVVRGGAVGLPQQIAGREIVGPRQIDLPLRTLGSLQSDAHRGIMLKCMLDGLLQRKGPRLRLRSLRPQDGYPASDHQRNH